MSYSLESDASEPKYEVVPALFPASQPGTGSWPAWGFFGEAGRQLPNAQRMPESEEVMDENCQRIKKLLDLYREGKLTDVQKADVEYHLLVCPECIFLLTLVPSLNSD